MHDRSIFITENDLKRLREVIKNVSRDDAHEALRLARFEADLRHATVVESRKIPEDVVTMNSLVHLRDLDAPRERECWLRFSPGEGASRVISVLSDLGMALLGRREGDIVEWTSLSGNRRCKIVEIVYQPERLGNYDL